MDASQLSHATTKHNHDWPLQFGTLWLVYAKRAHENWSTPSTTDSVHHLQKEFGQTIRPVFIRYIDFETIVSIYIDIEFSCWKVQINAISQINNINSSEFEAEYEPARCRDEKCVTLLSGHQEDTHFIRDHIDQWELYVKVVWLGENLRYVIRKLYDQNIKKSPAKQKSFIVLHWTPSEVIDVNIDYDSIAMPACKQFIEIDRDSMCKYELMPILMYCSKQLIEETHIKTVFEIINFDHRHELYLLQLYNNLTDVQRAKNADDNSIVSIEHAMNRADDMEGIYDEIACKFLTEISETNAEVQKLKQEIANLSKLEVFIGGIYPKEEEQKNEHDG